jgi:hypothetical protein
MQDERQTDTAIVVRRGIGRPIITVAGGYTLTGRFDKGNVVNTNVFR